MGKVIKVENLSKAYQLGNVGTGTLSLDIERFWARIRGKEDPFLKIGEVNDRTVKSKSDVVWSLKDINFDIEQGDAVGIIGRNGAGKSTLLKILSHITAPTTGSVKIKGRVASLLEVGTGFHPELSGRENIYLNGAILGMRKSEIKRKFDEIVDFAGVERYIDTPVKKYSSGMYVRLAFGVAAHLESEILIVDEVLAVGDAEFQKKCLGKMGDISKGEGRTVLFVSHNMGSIAQLCDKTILLKNGFLAQFDTTTNAIKNYLNNQEKNTFIFSETINTNCYHSVEMISKNGLAKSIFGYNEELGIALTAYIANYNPNLEIALRLVDTLNNPIFTIHEYIGEQRADNIYKFKISIPEKFLTPGSYSWIICINHNNVKIYDLHENVLAFTIEETGSDFSKFKDANFGVVFPIYTLERY